MDAEAGTAAKLTSFSDMAVSRELLFDSLHGRLPRVCVHSNIAEFNPGFAAHIERDIYAARDVTFPAVELLTLPDGIIVHPDHDDVATAGNTFATDQLRNELRRPGTQPLAALEASTPMEEVAEDCLLVARYGHSTWGHWLGEILPRAIAAEAAAPGKFRYAVPGRTTDPNWDDVLPRNILGSLRAYGIGEDRLLRLHQGRRYRFARLHAVTSMWIYPYAIHPAVLNLLRRSLRAPRIRIAAAPRAAMLRLHGGQRGLINQEDIALLLRIKGFQLVDIGALPFLEQVAVFAQAESVFGVLGSNLAGLLYAPIGVQALSVAPGDWGECFFHGILQGLNARYVDLRGSPEPGAKYKMWANFSVPISRVTQALELLKATPHAA